MDRKQQERMQRRELLLEAAARVFGRKPFDEATMQEVAAEAQIGMQGLYEHFPSKQELYEQVAALRGEAFQVQAERALEGVEDPLDRIRAMALVYAEQFRDRPVFLPMFIRDRVHFDWDFNSRFGPRLREIYQAERGRLKAIIEKAVSLGELRPLDPEFLTQVCMDVLQASLHHSHQHQPGEDAAVCVDRAMDCLLNGLGVRP